MTIRVDQAIAHRAWKSARIAVLKAMETCGLIVLHGEPGTGKTLLLHDLAQALGSDYAAVTLHPRGDLADAPAVPESGRAVLLIDEGDHVSPEALAAMASPRIVIARLTPLTSVDAAIAARGQPVATVHLEHLSVDEVAGFIIERLASVGQPADAVDPNAVELMARDSGGVPRLVNMLLNAATFFAAGEGAGRVSTDHVNEAIAMRPAVAAIGPAPVAGDDAPGAPSVDATTDGLDDPQPSSDDLAANDNVAGMPRCAPPLVATAPTAVASTTVARRAWPGAVLGIAALAATAAAVFFVLGPVRHTARPPSPEHLDVASVDAAATSLASVPPPPLTTAVRGAQPHLPDLLPATHALAPHPPSAVAPPLATAPALPPAAATSIAQTAQSAAPVAPRLTAPVPPATAMTAAAPPRTPTVQAAGSNPPAPLSRPLRRVQTASRSTAPAPVEDADSGEAGSVRDLADVLRRYGADRPTAPAPPPPRRFVGVIATGPDGVRRFVPLPPED